MSTGADVEHAVRGRVTNEGLLKLSGACCNL
jgi:hypothetical protein